MISKSRKKKIFTVKKIAVVALLSIITLWSVSQGDIRTWFDGKSDYTLSLLERAVGRSDEPDKKNDIIYKWTDENGVRHFSNTRPSGVDEVETVPAKEYTVPSISLQEKEEKTFSSITNSPSKTVSKRPFIKLDGRYYCFELFNLQDNFYRILQRAICRIKPDYRREWNDKQKTVSEELPFKYLKKILPTAKIYQSIYYRWSTSPQQKKQWCEADGILIFEDHLFIIEVKAGAFTYTPPATDFPAYIDSLKNLIFKPAEQGHRFLDYLESEDKVDIFDSEHNKLTEISKNNFEYKNICAITIDNISRLASQSQHLKKIGIDVGPHPVWAISLDDLRVYSDIFDNPLVFLHFVEQRMASFHSSLIKTNDELDHLGLYLKHNAYTEYASDFGSESELIWNGYHSDIDEFFTNKLQGPSTPCPLKQSIPARLKEIIDFLNTTSIQGRRQLSSLLLDCGGTFRNDIATGIDQILSHQRNTGNSKSLSVYGQVNASLFCWQAGIVEQRKELALEHAKAAMLVANDNTRLLLELFFDRSERINNLEFQFINSKSIDKNELDKLAPIVGRLRKKRINKANKRDDKLGRNSLCPCGSGKKYKKCCLRNRYQQIEQHLR
ncbi:MAG: DUF4124 domain-containing protein [Candidatus Electrothrix sp. ATG2]|nr:DUF4124 domain-containing protein [Candidatus Electrothrix sp. ATG2]